jgi:hypothetical protein
VTAGHSLGRTLRVGARLGTVGQGVPVEGRVAEIVAAPSAVMRAAGPSAVLTLQTGVCELWRTPADLAEVSQRLTALVRAILTSFGRLRAVSPRIAVCQTL